MSSETDDVVDPERAALTAAYHRQKTGGIRDEWKSVGVQQITTFVPAKYANYFKALSNMSTAVEMLKRVDAMDEDVMQALGNRKPKYNVDLYMIDAIKDGSDENDAIASACANMETLLRAARREKSLGEAQTTAPEHILYHLAREYIIVYYVRGLYDMTLHKVKHGGAVPEVALDVRKGKVPHVL